MHIYTYLNVVGLLSAERWAFFMRRKNTQKGIFSMKAMINTITTNLNNHVKAYFVDMFSFVCSNSVLKSLYTDSLRPEVNDCLYGYSEPICRRLRC